MKLSELQLRYGQLMNEAQTIASAGFTAESRAKFDLITKDADEVYADIQREQRMEKFASEQRALNAPPRDGFASHSDTHKEHQKRAFFQWMRTGSSAGYEQRDLGAGSITGSITGGNVFVPQGINPIISAKKSVGQLVDFVNVFRTNDGMPIVIPSDNDTANGLTLVSEAASNTTDLDPVIGSFTSHVDTATSKPVSVSNELLSDAGFDVEKWLNDKLATRWKRGVANWISLGNSSNVAALAATAGVTSASPTAVSYTDLAGLWGSLDNAYIPGASFVMSSATRANLMGIVSTTGQPILQADANGTPFNSIFGAPICIDENRPAIAATNQSILLGDLKEGYQLRVVGDFQIRALRELKALQNETVFVLYTRLGGLVSDAGNHPIRALTQHA